MNTLKIQHLQNCITKVITHQNNQLKDQEGLKDYEVPSGCHTSVHLSRVHK